MAMDQEAARAFAEKGEKIYAEAIKPHINLEKEKGKFLVIDVETGDYEIDKRMILASKKLRERKPDAITYGVRVGFSAAYRMGGRNLVPDNDNWEG